jgi:hypothetical protein
VTPEIRVYQEANAMVAVELILAITILWMVVTQPLLQHVIMKVVQDALAELKRGFVGGQ